MNMQFTLWRLQHNNSTNYKKLPVLLLVLL
jgi:hypothetical protein